jgi:hypothetical protein
MGAPTSGKAFRFDRHHLGFGGAGDFFGHLNYSLHFFHVVHANDMSAVQNSRRYGRRSGIKRFYFGAFGQERLLRWPDQDWIIKRRELFEMRQDFGVLLFPLAEAEARIDHDPPAFHSGMPGSAGGGLEFFRDHAQRILHRRQFGPRLGLTAHVVEDQTRISRGGDFRKIRIEGQARGVVYDFNAVFQRPFGDF